VYGADIADALQGTATGKDCDDEVAWTLTTMSPATASATAPAACNHFIPAVHHIAHAAHVLFGHEVEEQHSDHVLPVGLINRV
jgi:hypothetical protein